LGIKGGIAQGEELVWDGHLFRKGMIARNMGREDQAKVKLGVCLPLISLCRPSHYQGLDNAIEILTRYQIPFRLVPEISITMDWDGLDYLIVVTKSLSFQGLRKLRGFCAAGGVVICIGELLGLSCEIGIDEWIQLQKIT
jgi:hypothetical protein